MLVKTGWYYRNSPFIDESSEVFIVLDDPSWDIDHRYEKLKKSQSKSGDTLWSEEEILEPGYTVTIMKSNGVHKKYSVYNLVSVGEQDE